jgi:hypothetical protein
MSDNQKATQPAEVKMMPPITGAASQATATANPQVTVQVQQKPVRYQLFNNGGVTLAVPIFNKATEETDTVFLQHGGKPKLLPGFTVDAIFAARNPALQITKVTS